MASNLKPPSDKTVKFLYEGVIAFYPQVAKDVFALGKASLPYHETWGGFKRSDFLVLALNRTNSDSIDDAARIIKDWREGKGVERTVPDKLDEMVARLEEKEAKMAEYEKQKLAKEALLESQRAKEAVVAPKEAPTPAAAAPAAAPPAPSPSEETYAVGIKITPQTGKVFEKFANRVASAPVRAAVAFAAPTIAAQQGGATAGAMTLWARGIKSESLEKEASKVDIKEAKRFKELVNSIKNLESSYSLQTRIIQRSFPIKDISLLLGPEAGLTQAQVSVFFNPPGAGGTTVVPHRSFLGNLLEGAGRQVFGKLANKAVSRLASKAAGKVASKAAGKAVGGAAGTAVGGPVGTILGYVVGWLVNKVIGKVWDFLVKHKNILKAILFVPVIAAGLLFGIPILTFAGGVGMAVFLAGGAGAAVAGAGGALGSLFGTLGSLFVASVATPVIVALISIPVVVAIILFIINSAAYVVPPSALSLSENPYLRVEKSASPEGPFQNSQIPLTIQYKITIAALRGTLTNISFNLDCEVIRTGSAPACPPAKMVGPNGETVAEGPQPGLEISPVAPYVITYSATYSLPSFRDSAIIDTLSVTADVAEEKGTNTSGSAAVIIGNPPTGCFTFTNDWPASSKTREMGAIAEMSRARAFMTKLCSQGTITLDHEPQVARWGGWTKGLRYIVIYPLGVGNRSTALYTLSHESGHVLAQVTNLYQRYLDTQGLGSERPICTYPVSPHPASEDFAETVALYFSNRYGTPTGRFSCLGSQSFKSKYPQHWSFAKNSIFLENLGW